MLVRIGGKHGININLISSYNLISAFTSEHNNKLGYIDQSLSFLSCAMINKMDMAELNSIVEWCRTVEVTFDPFYTKRCNIRTTRSECPVIDIELLNAQITSENMPKKVRQYYRKLPIIS